jgi:NADPH:quinone reductase-like Zn-dependent oxidoreductase
MVCVSLPQSSSILTLLTIGLQFAKLSGFNPIITTASPKHTDFLKSLGATHVLDRNLSVQALKAEIEKITTKPIKYVYDAISSPETQKTGLEILTTGGHLMLVLQPHVTSTDKQVSDVISFRHLEPNVIPSIALYTKLSEWVEKGIIKVRVYGDDLYIRSFMKHLAL